MVVVKEQMEIEEMEMEKVLDHPMHRGRRHRTQKKKQKQKQKQQQQQQHDQDQAEDAGEAQVAEVATNSEPSVDSDKLSYEIFSVLESKFLFGLGGGGRTEVDHDLGGGNHQVMIEEGAAADLNDDVNNKQWQHRQEQQPKMGSNNYITVGAAATGVAAAAALSSSSSSSPLSMIMKKNQRGKVCILSIDGGTGMSSILIGKALVHLERTLREKSGDPEARISDFFDVAAGTGVGGIFIAMLFATRDGAAPLYSAEDTWRFLADQGRFLFLSASSRISYKKQQQQKKKSKKKNTTKGPTFNITAAAASGPGSRTEAAGGNNSSTTNITPSGNNRTSSSHMLQGTGANNVATAGNNQTSSSQLLGTTTNNNIAAAGNNQTTTAAGNTTTSSTGVGSNVVVGRTGATSCNNTSTSTSTTVHPSSTTVTSTSTPEITPEPPPAAAAAAAAATATAETGDSKSDKKKKKKEKEKNKTKTKKKKKKKKKRCLSCSPCCCSCGKPKIKCLCSSSPCCCFCGKPRIKCLSCSPCCGFCKKPPRCPTCKSNCCSCTGGVFRGCKLPTSGGLFRGCKLPTTLGRFRGCKLPTPKLKLPKLQLLPSCKLPPPPPACCSSGCGSGGCSSSCGTGGSCCSSGCKKKKRTVITATTEVEAILKDMFGERLTLRDTVKPVLIPCYDLRTSAPFLFSRADALESANFNFRLWEVCRATWAEPGRVDPAEIVSVDGATRCVGVDGGLVMSNPAAAAIAHVLCNKSEFPFVRGVEDLMVLSLGASGSSTSPLISSAPIPPPSSSSSSSKGGSTNSNYAWLKLGRRGKKKKNEFKVNQEDWARPIVRIATHGTADFVDQAVGMAFYNCRSSSNYVRIQPATRNGLEGISFSMRSSKSKLISSRCCSSRSREKDVKFKMTDIDNDPSDGNVEKLVRSADEMLQNKNVESVLFGGMKRVGEHTNAEILDWLAGRLVTEHRSRSSRIAPTVAIKQPPLKAPPTSPITTPDNSSSSSAAASTSSDYNSKST